MNETYRDQPRLLRSGANQKKRLRFLPLSLFSSIRHSSHTGSMYGCLRHNEAE